MVMRISDFAGGNTGPSPAPKPFNWAAGNLSLQPMSSIPSEPAQTVWPAGELAFQSHYQAPAQQSAPAPVMGQARSAQPDIGRYTPPVDYGNQPPIGGGGQGIMGGSDPGAGAPTGPAQGGRAWYNSLDQAGQQAEQDKFLGGDSDYIAQLGEYDRALADFKDRIAGQIKNFNTDAASATDATNKNLMNSQNQLGEDFGARGMSYSGLYDKSKNEMGTRFQDQIANIGLVRGRNEADALGRQKDYEAENTIGRGNAKRSALTRMMANQSMIDSNSGMF